MKIPSLLFGRFSSVRSRCRKVLRAVAAGATWNDAISVDGMADTQLVPGLLVLHGPSPLLGGEPHYHCYLPWSLLGDEKLRSSLPAISEDHVFDASLEIDWGTLGLLGQRNVMWIVPPARHRPFLEAVLRHWPTLYGEGVRYTAGSTAGQDLWSVHTNLKYVLANHGVALETLSAPLPPGGLAEVLTLVSDA